jgi:2-polyprenyl-3-methyl-5-hydroxy-6-metoxy-1,4-benzoquinol methylase
MKMTADADRERFRSGAHDYAAYLDTPEGRLRLDLTFANLKEFLPQSKHSLCALDLGSGTGAIAVRLARLGLHVTLLDSSRQMLDIAKRAAHEARVTEKITLTHGDAGQSGELFAGELFDVVLCHNVLEYVECPGAVLSDAARLMRREPPALLSMLVRNREGEVLKAAVQAGDLESAERGLTANWGVESLYGGRVRLFTPNELLAMSKEAGLEIIAERGVRVVADYLPPQISRETEYERIFKLERKLGQRPEFAAVARYMHYLARCPNPAMEEVA